MSAIQATIKNRLFIVIFSLLFISGSFTAANASTQPPDKMLEAATKKMLRAINTNRAEIKRSPEKLKSLVEEIILPHLDLITASKMVMGKYWRRADKTQKIQFIRQFRLMLLRFYSTALSEYLKGRDKKLNENLIHHFPIKLKDNDTTITVRAELTPDTGKKIPIRYRMHLKSKKGWKIYDVSVEGVSMVTTYKNNFATELKTKGVDGLIASLKAKNEQLLAKNDK